MRFDQWMTYKGYANATFGEIAGWSGETVRRYRNGSREPGFDEMRVVYRISDGLVTPNDWVGVGPCEDVVSDVTVGAVP